MLNSRSPIPLYRQLAEWLLDQIRSGQFPAGTRILSENELAARFSIGRPTVRQATDLLIRRGYLQRRRGAGTFVKDAPEEVDLFSLAGTLSAFQKKGIDIVSKVVTPVRLQPIAADATNPFGGQAAYRFSRLNLAQGQPVLFEDICLHPDLFAGIEHIDLSGRSLSQVVDTHFYLRPVSGRQSFRVTPVTDLPAAQLRVGANEPILLVERWLNFPDADNALFARMYCRTDQFVFSQRIGGFPDD